MSNLTQQSSITLSTSGRGFISITDQITALVKSSKISTGLCHLFLCHTSASLILCENADPQVQHDLQTFMQRLVTDGDPIFQHIAEGPDDMPAHVRTILTQSFLTIPIVKGHLALGTWQGVYLWEHRLHSHQRELIITLQGQA
jgi:secondary thiamine-phosphate synthase enzyme